jgi:hypothetical protein
MKTLHEKTGKQVVVLIDEYDKPITDVLEVGSNAKAHEHRSILRTFYSVVKGNSAHIRLFFLTGIARFAKVSIFSDLNNLTDLSKNKYYHNLLGYTQEELTHYFSEHLNFIAQEKNITLAALLAQIKEWYNGFSWNGVDRLYNPFSILNFLSAGEFGNYWFDSGTPQFLIEMLKKKRIYNVSSIKISPDLVNNMNIDRLNIETFFFQTGYLTVKEIDRTKRYLLDYPNREVEQSMTECILASYTDSPAEASVSLNLVEAVEKCDFELMKNTFDTLFASIPYQIFDQHKEKYFHAIIFLAFKLCGFHIHSEVSTAQGRIDALMQVENQVYIFEFKLNQSAEAAMAQIHERGYYKQFLGQDKDIYLVGINFSGETKSIEEMRTEKLS